MARIRSIKPEFFTNDALGELSADVRLLFIGLWTQADREGRLEYRPKRLKATLMPYDDCDIETMVGQLERAGFVTEYTVSDQRYLQVNKFTKHQSPHYREGASTIPAPDVDSTLTQHRTNVDSTSHAGREGKGREGKGEEGCSLKFGEQLPACLSAVEDGLTWNASDGTKHESAAKLIWHEIQLARGATTLSPTEVRTFASTIASSCLPGCDGGDQVAACVDCIIKAAEKSKGKPSPLFSKICKEDR